nr:MAG TPA: hypothetical protein [Caudoviricetes sp.]
MRTLIKLYQMFYVGICKLNYYITPLYEPILLFISPYV